MMRAYSEVYLEQAQYSLGSMLDHAVNDLSFGIDEFFTYFCVSGVAKSFGSGDCRYLAGMSGVELAAVVLEKTGLENRVRTPIVRLDRSQEFWTGWVLAYYQWWSMLSFEEIVLQMKPSALIRLYSPYHEMDITHIVQELDAVCRKATRLGNRRTFLGLSQSQLAKASGVPVRTIQEYEQRARSINKAQADTVVALAKALGTESANLLENI